MPIESILSAWSDAVILRMRPFPFGTAAEKSEKIFESLNVIVKKRVVEKRIIVEKHVE